MKPTLSITLAILLAATGPSFAKESKASKDEQEDSGDAPGVASIIEMRPSEKRPLVLREDERNPYEKRTVQEDDFNEKDATSEEVRLREIITSLPISGSSRGPDGSLRLLLGDIKLEQGKYLPQMVQPQTDQLKVLEITPEFLTIAWIDPESNQPTGKTMQLQYDLSPTITFGLPGQMSNNGEGNASKERLGVMNIGKMRKKLAAQLAAEKEEQRHFSGHAMNNDEKEN